MSSTGGRGASVVAAPASGVAVVGAATSRSFSSATATGEGQAHIKSTAPSLSKVALKIVREEGFLGLYRGFGACFCRDVGQNAAYYFLAESLNRYFVDADVLSPTVAPFVAGAMTGT